jgi:hypothetical protein
MNEAIGFVVQVGPIVGVLTLAGVWVIHLIQYSYQEGQKDARLVAIEKKTESVSDTAALMAGLQATVHALKDTVDKLDHTVTNMLQGKISLPNSQRSNRRSDQT